jgi:hypothetical protein
MISMELIRTGIPNENLTWKIAAYKIEITK